MPVLSLTSDLQRTAQAESEQCKPGDHHSPREGETGSAATQPRRSHGLSVYCYALQVLSLLAAGHDNYNQGNLPGEMEALLASKSGSQQPGPDTMRLGQGCWQVKAVGACRALQRLL